jgi:predicted  nucleic acid-binding Zn-ribbon protein
MRALYSGALKAVRDNKNRWRIEVSDLEHWSEQRPDRAQNMTGQDTERDTDTLTRLVAAETRAEMLEEQLSELRTERDRARADADAQREMLRAALDDMRNRPSIWSRLFRS